MAACNINGKSLNLADCLILKPGGKTVAETYDQPSDLINIIVPNVFVLAGIFLFLMTIFAGFKFAMQGSKGKDDAKGIIQTVIVGFLVMFAAYWIVQIIELLTGVTIFL
jgi:hypothetical protein